MASLPSTIELNLLVVSDVLCWKSADDEQKSVIATRVFNRLKDITTQEVKKVISSLCLPKNDRTLVEDMLQDSFIKLLEILPKWDYFRCPVFITFWRRCVRNHLLTCYYTKNRENNGLEDNRIDCVGGEELDFQKMLIEEIVVYFSQYFQEGSFLMVILKERIFASAKKKQVDLAHQFQYSQCYVSRWENELAEMIRQEFGDLKSY